MNWYPYPTSALDSLIWLAAVAVPIGGYIALWVCLIRDDMASNRSQDKASGVE